MANRETKKKEFLHFHFQNQQNKTQSDKKKERVKKAKIQGNLMFRKHDKAI